MRVLYKVRWKPEPKLNYTKLINLLKESSKSYWKRVRGPRLKLRLKLLIKKAVKCKEN